MNLHSPLSSILTRPSIVYPSTLSTSLLAGMYVRVPLDVETTPLPEAHRSFTLAQISALSLPDMEVEVFLWELLDGQPKRREQRQIPIAYVRRCTVAPGVRFYHINSGLSGKILYPVDEYCEQNKLQRYFVEIDGDVQIVSEDELLISSEEAQPNCLSQLLDYEFHTPLQKHQRDALIEKQAYLESATLGFSEFVGARVQLLTHQARVVQRVLNSPFCRFMLADEVGLGKTIEAGLILQGLDRLYSLSKVLILAPASLVRQWHTELEYKFRIKCDALLDVRSRNPRLENSSRIILAYEDLRADSSLRNWTTSQKWELLIADEAHNLRKMPEIYNLVHGISAVTERVLMLTATPVERRSQEYLRLLRLLDPGHYDRLTDAQFEQMLKNQDDIRDSVNYLKRGLSDDDFDPIEFRSEMMQIGDRLHDDAIIPRLLEEVRHNATDRGLAAATELLTYVSDNYRIESRVIRNRRANLGSERLPTRAVDLSYSYTPSTNEASAIDALHDYVYGCLLECKEVPQTIEYASMLFHACASSAKTLKDLLSLRRNRLANRDPAANNIYVNPRAAQIVTSAPLFGDEPRLLNTLFWHVERWEREDREWLRKAWVKRERLPVGQTNRLLQVLRCVRDMQYAGKKGLIFSSWYSTIEILRQMLVDRYGVDAVAEFHAHLTPEALQLEADWFQNASACHVLLLDETGGEGRNFQMADYIIHVDLPWTPAQLEQRIGRVDRLGRGGKVLSIMPVARNTIEEDLFSLWNKAFNIFRQPLSGLEIVLEEVQDQVLQAFSSNTRSGLGELLPRLIQEAKQLRDAVERESYFEEGSISPRHLSELRVLSAEFSRGDWLHTPTQALAAAKNRKIEIRKPSNVALIGPQNMDLSTVSEQPERRGSLETQVRRATFDRATAIQREDLTFLAPGEPFVDEAVRKVLKSDYSCAAVWRKVPKLERDTKIFDFTFNLRINPRPLYFARFSDCHLARIRGYLPLVTEHVYVGLDGRLIDKDSPVIAFLARPFQKGNDQDLGAITGQKPNLSQFKKSYPAGEWQATVVQAIDSAESYLAERVHAISADIEEARKDLFLQINGQQAASLWLYGQEDHKASVMLGESQQITRALLEGLSKPIWTLESATYWYLKAGKS